MKSHLSLPLLALLAFFPPFTPRSLPAQEERSADTTQFGSINIEGEEAKRDAYAEAQESAISFFKGMASQTAQIAQGAPPSPLSVPDDVLQYLEGVFLYCSVRTGACPLVLEGLLEVDVVNARINGNVQCPTLIRFWKAWAANDYERRLDYSLQTGLLESSAKFKSEVRPRFIKCQDTVRQEVSGSSNQAVYFRDRYREGSRPGVVPAKLAAFLEALRNKDPKVNVFMATGVMSVPGALPRMRRPGDSQAQPEPETSSKRPSSQKPSSGSAVKPKRRK